MFIKIVTLSCLAIAIVSYITLYHITPQVYRPGKPGPDPIPSNEFVKTHGRAIFVSSIVGLAVGSVGTVIFVSWAIWGLLAH